MTRVPKDRTYRVRQIPSHIDAHHLPALLVSLENSIGPLENVNVHSLAGSLNTFEDVPTKTATVTFNSVPKAFDNDRTEWVFQTRRLGLQKNIIFDIHFIGFTALNDVDPNTHTLDCIAISGLASHPFGSWKQRDEGDKKSNFMWLRDQLPHDLKQIRSILYGYDTKLLMSESFQTVEDLALSLIARLDSIGRSLLSAKPLVFLAHSLGGIILKRALVEMANSNVKQNFMLNAVRQIILFGVPNRGMQMSHLLPMVEGKPNAGLVEILSPESTYLPKLDDQFNGIMLLRKIRLVSVYETARTQVPTQSASGEWLRNGSFEILVDRESAIQQRSTALDVIPINHDHSNLVKFTEDSVDYAVIARKLREVSGDATVDSPQDVPALATATDNGERSTFDSRRLFTSLSRSFPWMQKPKAVTATNTVLAAPSEPTTGRPELKGSNMHEIGTPPLKLNVKLQEQAAPIDKNNILSKMISSLYIRETEIRLEEVSDNYGTTFEWIWTDTDLNFRAWLKHGSGGYWISGKPGSGKSTLMKYIYTKCSNGDKLPTLSEKRGQIFIGFFFHDRGSYLQKSFEGLLHSILYQILHEEPRLAKEIMAVYLQRKEPEKAPWLLPDLIQAFSRIIEQDTVPVDIYLFLDALDEFSGSPEIIAGFIQSIIDRPDKHAAEIKICFSSRPWNTFIDRFSQCSGFKIHEQTRQDIQKYISGRLADNPSTAILLTSTDIHVRKAVEKLASDTMERAEGVFLWLKLVMDDLIRAHAEGASLTELTQNLSTFPKDLEDLYKNIIQRIPQEFRQEGYYMLEIVLRSDEQLSVESYMSCLICARCKTLENCIAKLETEFSTIPSFDSVVRRLKSRCGGLIELITDSKSWQAELQFMHQTVKDFISLPGFQKLITQEDNLIPEENGYTILGKRLLAIGLSRVRKTDIDPRLVPWERIWEIFWVRRHLFYQAEVSTGKSQKNLLDEADSIISHFERPGLPSESYPFNTMISFGVAANLYLYIQETLQERQCVNSNPKISLLHCAVLAASSSNLNFASLNGSDIPRAADFSEMTKLLLSHGADLKALWENLTPFQLLFKRWLELYDSELYDSELYDPELYDSELYDSPGYSIIHRSLLTIVSAFLDGGQDPNDILDQQGRTALDFCMEVLLFKLDTIFYHFKPKELIQLTLLLVENGACITKAGQRVLGRFVSNLERFGCKPADIDRIRSAPLLPKKQQVVPTMKKLFQQMGKRFDI